MPKLIIVMLALAVLLLPAGIFAQYQDPGVPDTVRLSGGPLLIGQSVPINVFVYNDEPIQIMAVVVSVASAQGGQARFDSVSYCGRLADPSVLSWRTVNHADGYGILPDTVLIYGFNFNKNNLGVGSGIDMKMYFTGLIAGSVRIDSCSYGPARTGLQFLEPYAPDIGIFTPYFRPLVVPVLASPRPPEMTISKRDQISTSAVPVTIDVTGQSVAGGSTAISLLSFTSEDDESTVPSSSPVLTGTNPATLSWTPGAGDIGIWKAVFQATDSIGQVTTDWARVQVVADNGYILSFNTVETDSTPQSTGIVVGDLDNDNAPELFITATPLVPMIGYAAYDITPQGQFVETYRTDEDGLYLPCHGPQLGYLNGDNYLDAVGSQTFHLDVLHGTGGGKFREYDSLEMHSAAWTSGALTDFNGDAFLDYASASQDGVRILTADANSRFHPAGSISLADQARSINSADFNGDGWEDLAIGTVAGLDVYLNNHGTGYTKAHAYSQAYGSLDIQVTNQGSDFNNDNIYDLCLATPSVGGAASELVVYLGYGDGSFDQRIIRTVKGQIFATSAGDFNGDNLLDIAFVNGSRRYVSILFGDGNGSFSNEIRFAIPKYDPAHLVSLDFDNDGDLDVVVSSYRFQEGSALFLFENELNSTALAAKSLEIMAEDNAKTELVSPGGSVINSVRQSLSSGAFHRRNLNGNGSIDQVVRCAAIESGAYSLNMTPKENLPAGSVFSLRYSVDGKTYRIAKDAPMPAAGYSFAIYPHGSSPVSPALGEHISNSQPSFSWPGQGPFQFELAADPSFSSIIASGEVAEAMYTLTSSLPEADTAIYYWRVRPTEATTWNGFYSFNALPSPTGVEPPASDAGLPKSFALGQNYPNPFNPGTTISYDLPRRVPVRLEVFNVVGQKVATLVDGTQEAGHQIALWNGHETNGAAAASGVYFYRLSAGEFVATAKMVLLK